MSATPARLEIIEQGPSSVALRGEIDAASAPFLAERVAPWPTGDGSVEIVLSEVTFMDSSGLRVLIDLQHRVDAASQVLTLRAPSETVQRLLEVSGLSDHFNVVG